MKAFKTILLSFDVLFILAVAFVLFFPRPYDDTDDSIGGKRSGMSLYIDRGTGCHYVSTFIGGMSPRYNPSGKQICREIDKREIVWKTK
jgi:hypothetical protein